MHYGPEFLLWMRVVMLSQPWLEKRISSSVGYSSIKANCTIAPSGIQILFLRSDVTWNTVICQMSASSEEALTSNANYEKRVWHVTVLESYRCQELKCVPRRELGILMLPGGSGGVFSESWWTRC